MNGHQPLDVRYTHPDTPESFNGFDAALGKIIGTASKKVLGVLNVGETPLGPGLDKGVPGIGAYDLRHGAVFDSRAVFIVGKDYYEDRMHRTIILMLLGSMLNPANRPCSRLT